MTQKSWDSLDWKDARDSAMAIFMFCQLAKANNLTSDTHVRQSLVIDWLKPQKTDCSKPPQDFGLTKIWFWWSHVPLFLRCCGQAIISQQNSSLVSAWKTDMLTSASRLQRQHVWLKKVAKYRIVHDQSALCFFFVGSVAEPVVNSWSEATLCELQLFLLCSQPQILFSAS